MLIFQLPLIPLHQFLNDNGFMSVIDVIRTDHPPKINIEVRRPNSFWLSHNSSNAHPEMRDTTIVISDNNGHIWVAPHSNFSFEARGKLFEDLRLAYGLQYIDTTHQPLPPAA